jgi:hypothetical protein
MRIMAAAVPTPIPAAAPVDREFPDVETGVVEFDSPVPAVLEADVVAAVLEAEVVASVTPVAVEARSDD